ncbi:hypothetical protein [Pseudomonas mohnii]
MLIIKLAAVIEIAAGIYLGDGVMGGLGVIALACAAIGTVPKQKLESNFYA